MRAYLHLIGPIRFDISDRAVRRAGLDYWDEVRLDVHDTPERFLEWLGERRPWLVTKYGNLRYNEPDYKNEDVLIFGNENTGLPDAWKRRWQDRTLYIPILGNIRSYNLSNTVSIVLAHASLKAGLYDSER